MKLLMKGQRVQALVQGVHIYSLIKKALGKGSTSNGIALPPDLSSVQAKKRGGCWGSCRLHDRGRFGLNWEFESRCNCIKSFENGFPRVVVVGLILSMLG